MAFVLFRMDILLNMCFVPVIMTVQLDVCLCSYSARDVGLYWAGSIGHSMLVLVPGAILGM
jgi:hypothetical protein